MSKIFVLALFFFSTVIAHDSDSESCSSSGSSEEGDGHGGHGGHGHGHGGGRPRPPGPRPPRPTRSECEAGWLRFERTNGVWCVLVGNTGVTNGYMSQDQAQAACSGRGAVLTGFENDNERITVANEALKQVTAMGRTVGGLWLGATNNPGCKVASCGPYNTYRWTDGHTTGNGGFHWGQGEPDNLNWPGNTICIQQFIMSPNFVAGPDDFAVWRTSFQHGDLDKYQCGAPAHPVTRLYACGKAGVRRSG